MDISWLRMLQTSPTEREGEREGEGERGGERERESEKRQRRNGRWAILCRCVGYLSKNYSFSLILAQKARKYGFHKIGHNSQVSQK
jgi:hypothetical protein